MNKIFKITSLLLVLLISACNNGGNNFVPALDDVPLPEGFTADPGMSSFFDSPEGRIAEVSASGIKSEKEVKSFYANTLPQLGWKKVDDLIYTKEGELLGIDITRGQEVTNVTYSIKPGINF